MFYPAGEEQLRCDELLASPSSSFSSTPRSSTSISWRAVSRISEKEDLRSNLPFRRASTIRKRKQRTANPRGLSTTLVRTTSETSSCGVSRRSKSQLSQAASIQMSGKLRSSGEIYQQFGSRAGSRRVDSRPPWPRYARLMRGADVGLSLMSTPHPSYPPLDLAACGAVSVTNRYGPKRDLSVYSPENILCADLGAEALADEFTRAIALAFDDDRRSGNYARQRFRAELARFSGPCA